METKNSPDQTLLSPEDGNPFSPQLDLEGELQSGGFLVLTAASTVKRTQIYLQEHLSIHCHALPKTMDLIMEPFFIEFGDGWKSECTTSQKKIL